MKTVSVHGDTHQFPDSATDEDISNALGSYYSGSAQGGTPEANAPVTPATDKPDTSGVAGGILSLGKGTAEGVPIVGPAIQGGIERASAGVRSLLHGTSYADELKGVQDRYSSAAEQHPGLNTAGEILGNTAAYGAAGSTGLGARLLGTAADLAIPQMLLRGAGSGALINAADAAIRGGDPVKAGAIGGILGIGGNAAGKVIGDAIGSAATSGAKAVTPQLTPQMLKDVATPVYKESVAVGNTIKLPTAAESGSAQQARDYANGFFKGGQPAAAPASSAADIAQGIRDNLHPLKLREANAGRTYRELSRLEGAQDLNDVAIARDKMRDIANGISQNKLIKVTGEDSKAARAAMNQLDTQMETFSPGWVEKNRIADANWAAARRAEEVMKAADKGTLGSFVKNETKTKGFTPEEIAAIKNAHTGGMLGAGLGAIGGGLNPFHGGLPGAMAAAVQAPAALWSGGTSLATIPVGMVADRAAQSLKKKALDAAVQKLLSRSPVGAAAMPSPVTRPPAAPMPNTLGLMLRGGINPLLQSQ